jgi:hypothetical protein
MVILNEIMNERSGIYLQQLTGVVGSPCIIAPVFR